MGWKHFKTQKYEIIWEVLLTYTLWGKKGNLSLHTQKYPIVWYHFANLSILMSELITMFWDKKKYKHAGGNGSKVLTGQEQIYEARLY